MSTTTEPVWSRLDAMAEQAEENYRALVCELAEHDKTECPDDEVRDILAAVGMSTDDLRRHVERAKRRLDAILGPKNSPDKEAALRAERSQAQATIDNLRAQYETTAERLGKRISDLDSEIFAEMHNVKADDRHRRQIIAQTAEPGTDPWNWRNFRLAEIESAIPGLPMI